jgi:hypothetical protein
MNRLDLDARHGRMMENRDKWENDHRSPHDFFRAGFSLHDGECMTAQGNTWLSSAGNPGEP